MRKIKLTQGKYALVDDTDFEWLNQYKWFAHYTNGHWYASSKLIDMHRLILNCPRGMVVDHINHNSLNNQRHNIRICTYSQNEQNSKAKGVTWHIRKKKWMATLMLNSKAIFLGYFIKRKDAVKARKKGEQKYFGEFAYGYKIQGIKA